jgi:hypothetical protein
MLVIPPLSLVNYVQLLYASGLYPGLSSNLYTYRPIALLNTLGKALEAIVANRLTF